MTFSKTQCIVFNMHRLSTPLLIFALFLTTASIMAILFFPSSRAASAAWGYLPQTAFKGINISQGKPGLTLNFKTTGWFRYKAFYLKHSNSHKQYLVVDLWPVYLPKDFKTPTFNYRDLKVKVAQYNPRTVRVVIHLRKKVIYQTQKTKTNLIVTLPTLSMPEQIVSSKRNREISKKVCIKALKLSQDEDGLQIKIFTDSKPYYKDFILPALNSRRISSRLVIDIWPAYLPKNFWSPSKIQHQIVKKVKIAQFNKQTVRLVLTLVPKKVPYNIQYLEKTLLLRVASGNHSGLKRSPSKLTSISKKTNIAPVSLPKVFNLKIRKIVIDPGHGGKDPGAIGYRGLKEKEVTLKIAKLLKEKLERRLHATVILTRTTDRFISLEKRASLANKMKADLFVSIHCNACPSHHLHGVETFFLGFTNDKRALEVAMRENATVNRRISELDKILQQLLVHAKIKESAYLASEVQESVVSTLRRQYNPVSNLGVKQAPFYVLVGTKMPAILIETSFIDNPKEGRRLRDPKYLNLLVDGICKGIVKYIKKTEEAYRYAPIEIGKGG